MSELFSLEKLMMESAVAVRPPEKLTVAEAAEKYRYLNNPGAYVGELKNSMTPYLVEPMNVLNSRDQTGMVFSGPAQSAKTEMFLNWLAYSAKVDPADMMLVQTSMNDARDFSMRRIDRMHRHSKKIGALLAAGKSADNTFDKQYVTGMMLTLGWPSINVLSGKPIPRLFLTDYDRMTPDVDGEGSPFDLARKRATTFGRNGMTAAESSPGYVIDDPAWEPSTPHEAPPTQGILALFNRGDRRLWYWDCVVCHGKFEPTFGLLKWPESKDHVEAGEACWLECPYCHSKYHHAPQGHMPGKYEMNLGGRWIKDGNVWMPDGSITGTARRSDIASFWLKGVAAAMQKWETLVVNWLAALEEYEKNGSEEALKTTTNVDQGVPYLPKALQSDRTPEHIRSRAREQPMHVVMPGVRFLAATVDVQKNRFVVQVHGIHDNKDREVIDRFEIKKSKRKDEDGEHLWVNPGAYPEDWKLLVEEVILRTYPLADGSGRRMGIKMTTCDSGGKAGVTSNAYGFVRWLRRGEDTDEQGEVIETKEEGTYQWQPGLAGRFILLKGGGRDAPRVSISFPDSQRKDRNAGARGEIPVLLINVNMVKDEVNARLDRTDPGGQYLFPKWLPPNFYIELTVEVKDPKKGWINPHNYRNESWDLLTYLEALLLTPTIQIDYLDFSNPPSWADVWDRNDLVFDPVATKGPFQAEPRKRRSLAELAEALG